MPKIHCYVPDEVAQKIQKKAKQAHISVSKYLALLINKEVSNQWPKDYFALFGQWQGDYEQRYDLD